MRAMDTNELKKLLKGSTAVLILENGDPSFVVLGYDSYKGFLSDQEKEVKINHPVRSESPGATPDRVPQEWAMPHSEHHALQADRTSNGISRPDHNFQQRIGEKESELLEKINKQILALKDEIEKEEKSTVVDE